MRGCLWIPYENAMDAFVEWRKRSPSYARSIRQTRYRLTLLHGKLRNTITPVDLIRAMDGMPPSVRNCTLRILGGLFNFSAKTGFCAAIPSSGWTCPSAARQRFRFTPEVTPILAAAEEPQPELVGISRRLVFLWHSARRGFAARLVCDGPPREFRETPASITKIRQGRHIEISENCRAWLAPHTKSQGRISIGSL